MRYRRQDVIARAVVLLDRDGLAGLTMRRLADDLGVRASALYHHVANKDALLGAVADAVLDAGRRPTEVVTWEAELRLVCVELRDVMVSHRDGAALIADVHARGLGAADPVRRMTAALEWAGADADLARTGARTLFHYVVGATHDPEAESFAIGLDVILRGLESTLAATPGDSRGVIVGETSGRHCG